MKNKARWAAWLLVLGLVLGGCGAAETKMQSDAVESAFGAEEDLIVVGVSQVGSESVWRTVNTESLQNVFTKDNGYFLLFKNARQKQENQIKAVRSFISQRVDYIVLSPLTETGWDTVFEEAKEAGIPVILIDRKANVKDESLYTAWVGSNFYWEGVQAGRILEKKLAAQGRENDTIRIVTLCGTAGGTATLGRSQGFEEVAEGHDNWIMLENVDGDFTTTKGKEQMRSLLRKYKDIDVVVSQNDDMTFGALASIEDAGLKAGERGDIMLISFDATKNGLELVKEGKIMADVECNPHLGEYVDEIIKALERGDSVRKERYVRENVYTKDNVEEALADR